MLNITIGNSVSRKTISVSHEAKVCDILEDNQIDIGTARITCNGETLTASQFSKSIGSIVGDDAESCYLLAVVKMDNGLK